MRKQMKQIVLALVVILSSSSVFAQTKVGDVTLKNSIEVSGTPLILNGAGVRSKYFMDLYVGALYLAKKSDNSYGIVHTEETQSVHITIISSMVTRDKFLSSTYEGFEKSIEGDTSPLKEEIETFMGSLTKEFAKGDHLEFNYQKTIGTTVKKNGKIIASIPGRDFKVALFGIWLGEKPADRNLKNGMLGK